MSMRTLMTFLLMLFVPAVFAADGASKQCGHESVWIQILGAGAGELDNDQAGPSYLVWLDDQARLLVNTGSGAATLFAKSGARFADLDALIYNDLSATRTASLPAFIAASEDAERDRPLPLLGPSGDEHYPDVRTFVERLIGPTSPYPQLADYLTFKSPGGYKISTREVPASGQRRWARFGSQNLRLAAMPVYNSGVPSVAWRVEIADFAIVFTGNFNNQKDVVADFAKGADALVVPHAVQEDVRGSLGERYVSPSKIAQIATRAEVRMLILGHRSNRTRGREIQSTDAIREHYTGPLIFANDLECWGL